MHDDTKRLQHFYKDFLEHFLQMQMFMQEVIDRVKAQKSYTDEDLCDIGFLFREIAKIADDLRKEGEAKRDLVGMLLAQRRTEQFMADPSFDTVVRGELAIGSPDVKQQGSVPKFGSPEYKALCRHFEIPEEAIASGLFSVNFNRLADILTKMAAEGKNPPPGVVKTYPKFNTIFRERK